MTLGDALRALHKAGRIRSPWLAGSEVRRWAELAGIYAGGLVLGLASLFLAASIHREVTLAIDPPVPDIRWERIASPAPEIECWALAADGRAAREHVVCLRRSP